MKKKHLGLRAYVIAYLLFLYAPIILLPMFAFNDATIIAFPLTGFTGKWFGGLLDTPALHDAVKNSLLIALTTSAAATTLGLFAAMAGTNHRFPAKKGIMGLIMLPLVMPDIIVAVSLLVVLVRVLDLHLGSWSVIVAHTLICMPFAISILNGAFANLDPAMEEAALDLGENRWTGFWLVTFPLVMPGIISSALITFTVSLDEFIIAFFLTGTSPTMPVYIWGLLRFPEQLPIVMALGTILVALSVLLLTIAEYFRRRGLARAGVQDKGGFL